MSEMTDGRLAELEMAIATAEALVARVRQLEAENAGLRAALAAEAERCARIAEGFVPADYGYGQMTRADLAAAAEAERIAAAIRRPVELPTSPAS